MFEPFRPSRPTRRVLTLALVLALNLPAALAQSDPADEEKNKNGFLPTGTYAGPNTTVNLQNGGLIIGIPLVSLPGRAGHDLNVTLSYNSKQLTAEYNGGQWVGRWFNEGPTCNPPQYPLPFAA